MCPIFCEFFKNYFFPKWSKKALKLLKPQDESANIKYSSSERKFNLKKLKQNQYCYHIKYHYVLKQGGQWTNPRPCSMTKTLLFFYSYVNRPSMRHWTSELAGITSWIWSIQSYLTKRTIKSSPFWNKVYDNIFISHIIKSQKNQSDVMSSEVLSKHEEITLWSSIVCTIENHPKKWSNHKKAMHHRNCPVPSQTTWQNNVSPFNEMHSHQ